jgi:tRNA (guanosine-2'-O-)-methyltransferase
MTPERQERLQSVLDKRQFNITVVLENVSDPHNISAVMRTCDAVGIQEIYVLNNKIPRHRKWGSKSSSSAAKWLTVHQFDDLDNCVSTLRSRYKKLYSTHLGKNSVDLYDLNLTEDVALIFGNEHSGVSEEMNHHADGNFIIPQVGIIRSLNISVACAVTIYEAYRQKNIVGHYKEPGAHHSMYKDLLSQWDLGLNEDNQ